MISFNNDYSTIAAARIMERMAAFSDRVFAEGYGLDEMCGSAIEKIKKKLNSQDVDVHLLVGGTQANAIMIAGMLRPYESIIACDSGHINVHESGAIEARGHRIETVRNINGKIDLEACEKLLSEHFEEHETVIRAIYISDSTELGTIYTLDELKQLRQFCDRHDLYLYMDGARLAVAMSSPANDISWNDLVKYCDCFYIGATKNGGMIGEAMVIVNDKLKPYYRNLMKQNGALLAKGYVLGIIFDTLFTDGYFEQLAQHSNRMAEILKNAIAAKGYSFLLDSPTNQQFVYFPNELVEQLQKEFIFAVWSKGEKESCVRLVTAYHTTEEEIEKFLERI